MQGAHPLDTVISVGGLGIGIASSSIDSLEMPQPPSSSPPAPAYADEPLLHVHGRQPSRSEAPQPGRLLPGAPSALCPLAPPGSAQGESFTCCILMLDLMTCTHATVNKQPAYASTHVHDSRQRPPKHE